jgi:hypothetical protein
MSLTETVYRLHVVLGRGASISSNIVCTGDANFFFLTKDIFEHYLDQFCALSGEYRVQMLM